MQYNPGMGIYQFASVVKSDSARSDLGSESRVCYCHPCVSGTVIYCSWRDIQPSEHELRWDRIENLMRPWVKQGKRCIIRVCPCRRDQATPDWVFEKGARYVQQHGIQTHHGIDYGSANKIPVYWDHVFLEKYEELVRMMAKRYDRHPDVEAVQIALGKWGEAFLGSEVDLGDLRHTLPEWRCHGYSVKCAIDTFKKIISIYLSHFENTPLIAMIGGPFVDSLESVGSKVNTEEIAAFCAEHDVWLQQNGFRLGYGNYVNAPQIFARYYRRTKVMYESCGAYPCPNAAFLLYAKRLIDSHISYFFPYPKAICDNDKTIQSAFDYIFKHIGYQLVASPIGGFEKIGERHFAVPIKWFNRGCAPVYAKLKGLLSFESGGSKHDLPCEIIPSTDLWAEKQTIFSKCYFRVPPGMSRAEYKMSLKLFAGVRESAGHDQQNGRPVKFTQSTPFPLFIAAGKDKKCNQLKRKKQ